MKNWNRCALVLVVGSIGAFGGTAQAQTEVSSKAAAEGLFDQGREAMRTGDFARACGLLERSQEIDPAVGTLLYLGECYERSGRTASAWATFREAASAGREIGQIDRARVADERAERLTPLLSKLTLELSEAARAIPGLVVRRHGQVVPPAAWNVAVPLDPGAYRIEASAPGYHDWSETIQVSDGASRTRAVIPVLQPKPGTSVSSGQPPAVTGAVQAGDPRTPGPPPIDAGSFKPPILAYALGGAGVVGIAVGSYFGLRAISKNDEAKDHCPAANRCDQPGVDLTDQASEAATISNIAFGVGLAALAGGVVFFLTAPSGAESPSLAAGIHPGGVSVGGSF